MTGVRVTGTDTVRIMGIDPGVTTGVCTIEIKRVPRRIVNAWHAQVTHPELVLAATLDEHTHAAQHRTALVVAMELPVLAPVSVRARAGVKQALEVYHMAERLATELGVQTWSAPAGAVKPWASDDRLRRAGLYFAGQRHARDAARVALAYARRAALLPDPFSERWVPRDCDAQ